MKVTDACEIQGDELLIICDFSPPRSAEPAVLDRVRELDADFLCVAYNPGRAVRVDSAMLAASIKLNTGKDVVFNLATRDMNKLALQSHLLGAQLLGLENIMVVQGDPFSERDLAKVKDVSDFTSTGLIESMNSMNEGVDFRGSKLREPTSLCIGGSIDVARGAEKEAALTLNKVRAGAQFFLVQPVFTVAEIDEFLDTYQSISGKDLSLPVFWGLQILEADGILFSSVPQSVRDDLEGGRPGTDIALSILREMVEHGIKRIYLVPPILRGGARNYDAAQAVLEAARNL